MISAICVNTALSSIHKNVISEHGISVAIDSSFYNATGVLDRQSIANLAVDEYYNSLGLANTPASIDNLVVIKRGKDKYSLTLIELKKVKKLSTLNYDNIVCKYKTTIDDFMSVRFNAEFNNPQHKITDFNLWLVCNRFNYMGNAISDADYERRIKSTIVEKLLLTKPFKFKGRIAAITPMLYDHADIV
ncbi:hypothetical protein [Aeromonas cavernicola]|uniref:Uncharacterized protein n=1 Tax=Aeromonas cavernicola TaxID=1006623 RepID=A0A2H9U249_9GAMM|nr:hypothetical protein [Aeromonas cavernicola]PJG58049.1 hypothetical protein CUC53_14655 [Aeromonas cavernicola]